MWTYCSKIDNDYEVTQNSLTKTCPNQQKQVLEIIYVTSANKYDGQIAHNLLNNEKTIILKKLLTRITQNRIVIETLLYPIKYSMLSTKNCRAKILIISFDIKQ